MAPNKPPYHRTPKGWLAQLLCRHEWTWVGGKEGKRIYRCWRCGKLKFVKEKPMELVNVESSFIGGIGFQEGVLLVQMKKGGGLYAYTGVPEDVYNAFLESLSKGDFFLRNVKGQYPSHEL